MYRILQGLRIIECSAFVAAPLAGMTLAQLGADVIRVDAPVGGPDADRWPVTREGASLYWAGLNKGKRSILIDIRSPEGRALIGDLVAAGGDGSGILITNFPARGALAYEALKERREDLILVNLTGMPDGSPAVDYTVNCAIGYPQITGAAREDAPNNHVFPAWDALAGLAIALSVLSAERHRRDTGEGQLVTLSLADMGYWMVGNLGQIGEVQINDADRAPLGNHVFGTFGSDFGTADGRRVMLMAMTRRQWGALVDVAGIAEGIAAFEKMWDLDLGREGDRFQAREAIAALLRPWVATHTLAEIAERLDTAGVLWGPYRNVRQMLAEDPHCTDANPLFDWIEQPGIGRLLAPGAPARFGALERTPLAPAPRLGEHTQAVLADVLGLDAARVAALEEAGVVAMTRQARPKV